MSGLACLAAFLWRPAHLCPRNARAGTVTVTSFSVSVLLDFQKTKRRDAGLRFRIARWRESTFPASRSCSALFSDKTTCQVSSQPVRFIEPSPSSRAWSTAPAPRVSSHLPPSPTPNTRAAPQPHVQVSLVHSLIHPFTHSFILQRSCLVTTP